MLVVLRGETLAGGFLTISSWGDSAARVRFPVTQAEENAASSVWGKQLCLTAHVAEPCERVRTGVLKEGRGRLSLPGWLGET